MTVPGLCAAVFVFIGMILDWGMILRIGNSQEIIIYYLAIYCVKINFDKYGRNDGIRITFFWE
jgi:hypothetical protein